MSEIKGRFSKGDTIFTGDSTYSSEFVSCPDCLGTLTWTVVFADGDAEQVACQTCRQGWADPSGKIEIKLWRPQVRTLTVGNVRYNDRDEVPFSYMCEETGVGTGRVYYEDKMFTDEASALEHANKTVEETMKHLAQNNYSKRFGGTKEIEAALSTWGFSRKTQLDKAMKFRQWAGISGITKKRT